MLKSVLCSTLGLCLAVGKKKPPLRVATTAAEAKDGAPGVPEIFAETASK
jgi:hypothetical protein